MLERTETALRTCQIQRPASFLAFCLKQKQAQAQKLEDKNKELVATTEQQSISINELNEQIETLKSSDAPKKGTTNSSTTPDETTVDYLKLENERLNQKTRNLIQQNRVHERTIKELEEKMSELCDVVVDQQLTSI